MAWAKEAVEERDMRAYRLLQGVISLNRRTAYAAVVWLMVIVNVLLFTFVIHIY